MMKQKIISFILAACLVFNFTIQAMPADAFDNTEESKAASSVSSEETPITVASGNAIFTAQEDPAESTEYTSESASESTEDEIIEEATMTAVLSNEISMEQSEPDETEDENIISGVCGLDTVYTYDKSTHILVVSGNGEATKLTGKIFDSDGSSRAYDEMETIIFKSGITYIGENFCIDAHSLAKVELADSITYIGDSAFNCCENLSDIKFSKNLTQIGKYAFLNTSWYNSQKDGIVYASKVAYSYKGEMPDGYELELKKGTIAIADDAFAYQQNIGKVKLPETLQYIGDRAFYCGERICFNCSRFSEVNFPETLQYIGDRAFYNCCSLSEINLSGNIEHVGEEAFYATDWYSNQAEEAIYIDKVFYKYKGAIPEGTTVTIKDGTTEISSSAFSCQYNFFSVNIPDSVVSIEKKAFLMSHFLTEVTIPDSVKSIGERAFEECIYLTSVKLPEKLVTIGESAFYQCRSLKSIVISKSVQTIGESAFYVCNSLTSVTLNEGLESIGKNAFYGCGSLKSIVIPKSVQFIGDSAFSCCNNLSIVKLPLIKDIVKNAFYDSNYFSFRPDHTPVMRTIIFEGGMEEITHKMMLPFTNPWCAVNNIILPDTVTTIDDSAFTNFTELEAIYLPESIKSIGDNAICSSAVPYCHVQKSQSAQLTPFA